MGTNSPEYDRQYWKTPKRQAYIKKYRDTEEYRAKQRERSRLYRERKQRENEALASKDDRL